MVEVTLVFRFIIIIGAGVRALLNTGTERNTPEWTRMVPERAGMTAEWTRMVPERAEMTAEWTRMVPERAGMDKNGTGIYRNKLGCHRNEEKDTSVTSECTEQIDVHGNDKGTNHNSTL